jgi:hypothetical protein
MKSWAGQRFQWHRSHAPPQNAVAPAVEDTILRLARGVMKSRVKKMHKTLRLPECDHLGPVNATDIEKIFQKYHLWTGKRTQTVKSPNRCRYEDDYNNIIWHSDLRHFYYGD